MTKIIRAGRHTAQGKAERTRHVDLGEKVITEGHNSSFQMSHLKQCHEKGEEQLLSLASEAIM